jgi:hypothetical protein
VFMSITGHRATPNESPESEPSNGTKYEPSGAAKEVTGS